MIPPSVAPVSRESDDPFASLVPFDSSDEPVETPPLFAPDPPVTVYVSRRIKPGCEMQFENLLNYMTRIVETFPGYLGTTLFRPNLVQHNSRFDKTDKFDNEYRVVFKFSHLSDLKRWEHSAERLAMLAELEPLMVAPEEFQRVTGLETWFTLPGQTEVVPPPRWKMAIVTGCAAYPLLNFAAMYLYPPMKDVPLPIRTAIGAVILVSMMTWGMMPLMTRVFSRWLYPK